MTLILEVCNFLKSKMAIHFQTLSLTALVRSAAHIGITLCLIMTHSELILLVVYRACVIILRAHAYTMLRKRIAISIK